MVFERSEGKARSGGLPTFFRSGLGVFRNGLAWGLPMAPAADVRATLVVRDAIRIRTAVQAKKCRIANNAQAADVRLVRGSLGTHDQGLMNGEQLAILLAEHELGISRHSCDFLELNEAGHD
jgi:hypothetical protein